MLPFITSQLMSLHSLADGKAFSALLELTDNFLVSYFKMRDLVGIGVTRALEREFG